MYSPLAVLPLHLACQFFIANNSTSNLAVNFSLAPVSPLPKLAIDLPEGYAVFPEIGVAYKNYRTRLSWNRARNICVSEGGNLAVIDSFRKIQIVVGLKETTSNLWVGIHRMFDSDEWTDVKTGLPTSSIPWGPWNSYDANKTRQCLSMWHDGTGVWAIDCNEIHPFICEVPIFKK